MKRKKIAAYIKEHEALRAEGINLVVSENHLSDAVRAALSSDLAGRYYAEWYGGAATARKIVETTEELAKEVFKAKYALVHPLSGNICDAAALLAFTREGDKAAILPFETGGYPFGLEKFKAARQEGVATPERWPLTVSFEGSLQASVQFLDALETYPYLPISHTRLKIDPVTLITSAEIQLTFQFRLDHADDGPSPPLRTTRYPLPDGEVPS